jgi:ABC-2 type transport system ATP-binding protein
MGKTKTVILSTHILPEVEATCDRAVILIDGRVRADATLAQITRSRVQVATLGTRDPAAAGEALARLAGVAGVETADCGDGFHTFRMQIGAEGEIGEAVAELARERGWRLRELRRDDRSLEHVFRELTESTAETLA